jgi:zinc transporter ZupT
MTWIAIPFACCTVAMTLVGGRIALKLAHNLPTVIAFTGGIVVAVALFEVLPEAIDAIGRAETTAALVGAGFLAFFLVERLLVLHHRDDPQQARAHHQVGALGATGLAIHSFIDGLGIGLAFGLDVATGVLVFIAVAAHDFADGMNMVSFVLMQTGDGGRARRWLVADAVAPLLGALVGGAIGISQHALGHVLALYVGFFIYLGATDLIPRRTTSTRRGRGWH